MKRLVLCLLLGVVLVGWVIPGASALSGDDPAINRQWGLERIGAPQAWDRGTGAGTIIAIIDSGIDLQHEDLTSKIVGHVSCIGANGDPSRCEGSGQDDHGHGTHVAGIAAAATDNARGGGGVAPGAGILAVKVLSADPVSGNAVGEISDVVAGIRAAADYGVDVINLSIGESGIIGGVTDPRLAEAIAYAWERGVVTVVPAGTFGSGYEDVNAMVVTATTYSNREASYSTGVGSAQWGIAAPGGEFGSNAGKIYSTWWMRNRRNAYAWVAGTSMAAPFVSGAAAVLRGLGLSPQETVERLLATATDIGTVGEDPVFGYGLLNLAGAASGYRSPLIEPPPTTVPTTVPPAPPPPPPTPGDSFGSVAEPATPPTTGPTVPATTAPSPTTTEPTQSSEVAVAQELPADRSSSGAAPWVIGGGTAAMALAMAFHSAVSRRPRVSR